MSSEPLSESDQDLLDALQAEWSKQVVDRIHARAARQVADREALLDEVRDIVRAEIAAALASPGVGVVH
jgi:hypothetical protein